jgi:hypothetical protein
MIGMTRQFSPEKTGRARTIRVMAKGRRRRKDQAEAPGTGITVQRPKISLLTPSGSEPTRCNSSRSRIVFQDVANVASVFLKLGTPDAQANL